MSIQAERAGSSSGQGRQGDGNVPNYQRLMEGLIAAHAGERPSLLLHVCCAPCSSYVLEYLSQYFRLHLYYFNPNIENQAEYLKRAEELRRMVAAMPLPEDVSVEIAPYDHDSFLAIARGLEDAPERGSRCVRCYRQRLEATAKKAAEDGGYDYFCTSLSISPLKDAALLNRLGEELAERYGQRYLPSDFKKKNGYRRSVELSEELGLYRQNYCGCEFSKRAAMQREPH